MSQEVRPTTSTLVTIHVNTPDYEITATFVTDSPFRQIKLDPETHFTSLLGEGITKLPSSFNTILSTFSGALLISVFVLVAQTGDPLSVYSTKLPSFWKFNLVALLLAVLLDHMY